VLEDKTKSGLEERDRRFDTKYNAECDSGIIYDVGGTEHRVGIRWFFPQSKFTLDESGSLKGSMNAIWLLEKSPVQTTNSRDKGNGDCYRNSCG
jgi:hypothetical protein